MITTWGTEAMEWAADQRSGSVCFGPVSKEAVLKMAELTGDFHPVRLVYRVAGEAGYGGLVLHPVWISGMADAIMRGAFAAGRIRSLSIAYRSAALDTDTLTVSLTCEEHDARTGQVSVSFSVRNQQNVVVADGTGCIAQRTPQIVRNVPRET